MSSPSSPRHALSSTTHADTQEGVRRNTIMHVRISLCVLILTLWSASPRVDAGERLAMTVSPVQSFAPATLRIQVQLERDADNRTLEVAADSGDFYRSSVLELHGDLAPRILFVEFRSVPSGQYEIRGALKDGAGQERACVHRHAFVIARDADH